MGGADAPIDDWADALVRVGAARPGPPEAARILVERRHVGGVDVPVEQPRLERALYVGAGRVAVAVARLTGVVAQVVQLRPLERPPDQLVAGGPDHRGPADRQRLVLLQPRLRVVDVPGIAADLVAA